MSVLTQLTVPGEAKPLKIAPEAIYTSSWESGIAFFIGFQFLEHVLKIGLSVLKKCTVTIFFLFTNYFA